MTYKKFEDIQVWQDSRKFVNLIYDLIRSDSKLAKDFSLCDQLKRAGYSIMLNIAEGFERRSKKEFANFLNIAKGSAGEVRSILYVTQDNFELPKDKLDTLNRQIIKISAQLFWLRNYLLK